MSSLNRLLRHECVPTFMPVEFFFFPLSKVSYWCIVGSFGMNRMQKGISGISHYIKKQMEEASLSFGWNIFGLFVLNKLSSR